MNKLDVLIKARKLLSDPMRWVKGAYKVEGSEYFDDEGNNRPEVDGGFCYCAIGALQAACGIDMERVEQADCWDEYYDGPRPVSVTIPEVYTEAKQALLDQLPTMDKKMIDYRGEERPWYEVESFNDHATVTYEDVLSLFSKAIQAEANSQEQPDAEQTAVIA